MEEKTPKDEQQSMSENAIKIQKYLANVDVLRDSHLNIKKHLDMNEDDYSKAKEELLRSNNSSIKPRRGPGGGLRLIPSSLELPEVNEVEIEAAKAEEAKAERQRQETAEKAEKDLYPSVLKWAVDAGYDMAAVVADNHERGSWENSDILAISVNDLKWHVGTDFEVTSIEVKLNFDVKALWQAAHYRTFSHFVYLACYESAETIREKADGRLYEAAVELGIGMLSLRQAGAGGKGVKCNEINSPNRQAPRIADVDALIAHYSSIFDKLQQPGKRIAAQLSQIR